MWARDDKLMFVGLVDVKWRGANAFMPVLKFVF